ncbi:MAG: hypothetical protein JJU02_01575 [Cryomorphaceae bacterium]|nr:hypothetical protein [Cryomorphaceae bacterium]
MISINIDKEDFCRKGLFGVDSVFNRFGCDCTFRGFVNPIAPSIYRGVRCSFRESGLGAV